MRLFFENLEVRSPDFHHLHSISAAPVFDAFLPPTSLKRSLSRKASSQVSRHPVNPALRWSDTAALRKRATWGSVWREGEGWADETGAESEFEFRMFADLYHIMNPPYAYLTRTARTDALDA